MFINGKRQQRFTQLNADYKNTLKKKIVEIDSQLKKIDRNHKTQLEILEGNKENRKKQNLQLLIILGGVIVFIIIIFLLNKLGN